MKAASILREPATVVMHLNEGFTRVLLDRTVGVGLAEGGICWDIPTDQIPAALRTIGSRFVVTMQTRMPEPSDSAEEMRAAMSCFTVEPLVESD